MARALAEEQQAIAAILCAAAAINEGSEKHGGNGEKAANAEQLTSTVA